MIKLDLIKQLVKTEYKEVLDEYLKSVETTDLWNLLANLVKLDCMLPGWEDGINKALVPYKVKLKHEDKQMAERQTLNSTYTLISEDGRTNIYVMPASDKTATDLGCIRFEGIDEIHYVLPYNRPDFKDDVRLFTDVILTDAKLAKATDVHFAPESNLDETFSYNIKFRKGIYLYPQTKYHLTRKLLDDVIQDMIYNRSSVEHKYAELIILSGVRFRLVEERFPARCQVANSIGGKALVVRMFDFKNPPEIETLGFDLDTQNMLRQISKTSGGLTLVSGAFGSGKGTTLNAVGMRMENDGKFAIASLDDPIEYLRRYMQYEYSSAHQLAEYIESFKKMDLNVVYLNEIITKVTADAVFNLVSSGIHILSTIHNKRVYKIMYKVKELFGDNYLNLIPFINVLTYQTKFSITCKKCLVGISEEGYLPGTPERQLLKFLNLQTIIQPRGCSHCLQGIDNSGIKVISEHLSFTDEIKDDLLKRDIHQQFNYLKDKLEQGHSLEKQIKEALVNGEILIGEVLTNIDSWM